MVLYRFAERCSFHLSDIQAMSIALTSHHSTRIHIVGESCQKQNSVLWVLANILCPYLGTYRNWQLKDQCIRLSVLKTFKWLKKFNSDIKITELRASQSGEVKGTLIVLLEALDVCKIPARQFLWKRNFSWKICKVRAPNNNINRVQDSIKRSEDQQGMAFWKPIWFQL